MVRPSKMSDPADSMRLDKWLWAARFFKTRQLAAEAVSGGHVHLNGQRSKPGKDVQVGSRLGISKGELSWEIEILVLPKQRRPAQEAARLARMAQPLRTESRPSKRDRRLIQRFKQGQS